MTDFEVLTPKAFLERGSGTVSLGTAPDGLPLYLQVGAAPSAASLLQDAARALHATPAAADLTGTPLAPVAQLLDEQLRLSRVRELESPTGPVAVRVIPVPVRTLAGETLLCRLLHAPSSALGPGIGGSAGTGSFGGHARPSPTTPAPAAMALSLADGPSFRRADLWLGLCVESGRLAIVRRELGTTGWSSFSFARYFRDETLLGFEGARFVRASAPDVDAPVTDRGKYLAARERDWADGCSRGNPFSPDYAWNVRVPRNAVARALLDLTFGVARLHSTGQVHGDIKPSNALVTAKGVHLFDGLGVAPGQRSPAMTQGWAAPEQVLARPVSFQTDQYAVGLLLLSLVGGVAYGERVSVLVPRGGNALEEHALLRDPGAFIDTSLGTVDPAAIEEWRALIERCMRFDAEGRFPATMTLVDSLKRVVERDTLRGYLEMPASFGRLLGLFATAAGSHEMGWLACSVAG